MDEVEILHQCKNARKCGKLGAAVIDRPSRRAMLLKCPHCGYTFWQFTKGEADGAGDSVQAEG